MKPIFNQPIFNLLEQSHTHPIIMGILNVTPDSFSDGGNYLELPKAVDHALAMLEQGAQIIDIGGQSSRPGSKPVPLEQELERVLPVQEAILKAAPDTLISIDTYRAEVAQRTIDLGASLINDISAGTFEPEILKIVAKTKTPIVLMHIQNTPETMQHQPTYSNVLHDVQLWLQNRVNDALNAGCHKNQLIIDPGIGFGKNLDHNLQLLANLHHLTPLNLPILLGVSRKSLFPQLLSTHQLTNPLDRDLATAIITSLTASQGVSIFRVHNVKATDQALRLVKALKEAQSPPN